jgi:nitrate reductase cytochrome c-type subunit
MARLRQASLGFAALLLAASAGCSGEEPQGGGDTVDVPGRTGAVKTAASGRAERRAYDGAPPVIPHGEMGVACTQCHNRTGQAVPDLGFAPPSPHGVEAELGGLARCRQCHVPAETDSLFVDNDFVGFAQDLRAGTRATQTAPPVMPHPKQMRENCLACHSGPAAREEIRTSHPERERCDQCHVEQVATDEFRRAGF